MLEPVDAEDMSKERLKEEREKMINDAMGMSFFAPPVPRKKPKKYGRPNAKESKAECIKGDITNYRRATCIVLRTSC